MSHFAYKKGVATHVRLSAITSPPAHTRFRGYCDTHGLRWPPEVKWWSQ